MVKVAAKDGEENASTANAIIVFMVIPVFSDTGGWQAVGVLKVGYGGAAYSQK